VCSPSLRRWQYAAEAVFPADYDDGTNGHNFTQTILKKILNEKLVNESGVAEVFFAFIEYRDYRIFQ
jgi:hypothetical protein